MPSLRRDLQLTFDEQDSTIARFSITQGSDAPVQLVAEHPDGRQSAVHVNALLGRSFVSASSASQMTVAT